MAFVVALEGVSLSGKTTLSQRLAELSFLGRPAIRVDCYADMVGGGGFLPAEIVETIEERELAIREFLRIEHERTQRARTTEPSVVVLDRSIYTLLAHSYYLESLLGPGFVARSLELLRGSDKVMWPDIILYLDAPAHVLAGRNEAKFGIGNLMIDDTYRTVFAAFFNDLPAGSPPVVRLDAAAPIETLVKTAAAEIAKGCASLDASRRPT